MWGGSSLSANPGPEGGNQGLLFPTWPDRQGCLGLVSLGTERLFGKWLPEDKDRAVWFVLTRSSQHRATHATVAPYMFVE